MEITCTFEHFDPKFYSGATMYYVIAETCPYNLGHIRDGKEGIASG